jgi:hypothetical protein
MRTLLIHTGILLGLGLTTAASYAGTNVLSCRKSVGALVKDCYINVPSLPGTEAIYGVDAYEADYVVEAEVINCPLGKAFQSNWNITANGGATYSKEYVQVGNGSRTRLYATGYGPISVGDDRPALTAFWSLYPSCELSFTVVSAVPSSNTSQRWLTEAASIDRELTLATALYKTKVSVDSWFTKYHEDKEGGSALLEIILEELNADLTVVTGDEKSAIERQVAAISAILADASYETVVGPYNEIRQTLAQKLPVAEAYLSKLNFAKRSSEIALESHINDARNVMAN